MRPPGKIPFTLLFSTTPPSTFNFLFFSSQSGTRDRFSPFWQAAKRSRRLCYYVRRRRLVVVRRGHRPTTTNGDSSSSSNKPMTTMEHHTTSSTTLFDPFGIASDVLQQPDHEPTMEGQKQQQQQHHHAVSSSPSSIIISMDPFAAASAAAATTASSSSKKSLLLKTTKKTFLFQHSSSPPHGPPEVSRVTRSSTYRSTLTNVSSSATTTTAANRGPSPRRGGGERGGASSSSNRNITAAAAAAAAAAVPMSSTTPGSSSHPHLRTLPPKLQVRMTKYEEVASQSYSDDVGAATVSVEGSLYVQVQGSDALKNAPFALRPLSPYSNHNNGMNSSSGGSSSSSSNNNRLSIKPNTRYTTQAPPPPAAAAPADNNNNNNSPSSEQQLIVHVPKTEIGFVPVIHYSFQQTMAHMPVLLERKVTIHEMSVRIALQVRSKLTNRGNLRDFCLAVAVPEHVDASTVQIVRGTTSTSRGHGGHGSGGGSTFDPLTRLIKFRLDHLPKGESFMVSAQAKLWKPHRPATTTTAAADQQQQVRKEGEEKVAISDGMENVDNGDPPIVFPVMLRCSSSEDQMSDVEFEAMEAPGIPCSITSFKAHSFRLLHRLT